MKATLEIPDELYRKVKARSALEGRTLRSVAVQLFQSWLGSGTGDELPSKLTQSELKAAPWLAITHPYMKPGMDHDMESIRSAIQRGWESEESRDSDS